MTCTDCERHISEALREAGAVDPVADFRRGEAHFSAPATIEPKVFEAAVGQTSYRPGKIEVRRPERVETRTNGARGGRDRYDLAIVGSRGGAFAAAITAVERGARAAMIERGTLGGTCVNIGCVPSKTQLRAGGLYWHAGHHSFQGIRTRAESVDLPALVGQKDELVASLRQEKYRNLIGEYGWEFIQGEASFEDSRTLRVGERPGARAMGTALGALSFEGLTFAYPGTSRPALTDVSFDVPPGQLVALVGPSGAGKTTATYLLARFYDPTDGGVRLDGVDLRDLTLESVSAQIGIVFQDTFLFHASVRQNLLYARPEARQDEIEAAARAAHIHDFIECCPTDTRRWSASAGIA